MSPRCLTHNVFSFIKYEPSKDGYLRDKSNSGLIPLTFNQLSLTYPMQHVGLIAETEQNQELESYFNLIFFGQILVIEGSNLDSKEARVHIL